MVTQALFQRIDVHLLAVAVDAEMTGLAGECMSAYDCIGPRRLAVVLGAA